MVVWAQSSQRATCPAEGRRAAALDGTHHLELVEADVTAVGMTPCGPVAAQDVRDLQSWPGHVGRLCRRRLPRQRQPLQRAHHRAQHVGGDVSIAGGHVQLRMAQQHLNHPHVDIALQQMRGKRVPKRMRSDPAAEPRRLASQPDRPSGTTAATFWCVPLRFRQRAAWRNDAAGDAVPSSAGRPIRVRRTYRRLAVLRQAGICPHLSAPDARILEPSPAMWVGRRGYFGSRLPVLTAISKVVDEVRQ